MLSYPSNVKVSHAYRVAVGVDSTVLLGFPYLNLCPNFRNLDSKYLNEISANINTVISDNKVGINDAISWNFGDAFPKAWCMILEIA